MNKMVEDEEEVVMKDSSYSYYYHHDDHEVKLSYTFIVRVLFVATPL